MIKHDISRAIIRHRWKTNCGIVRGQIGHGARNRFINAGDARRQLVLDGNAAPAGISGSRMRHFDGQRLADVRAGNGWTGRNRQSVRAHYGYRESIRPGWRTGERIGVCEDGLRVDESLTELVERNLNATVAGKGALGVERNLACANEERSRQKATETIHGMCSFD